MCSKHKKETPGVNEDEYTLERHKGVKKEEVGGEEDKLQRQNVNDIEKGARCSAVGTGASSPCARMHPGCWKIGAS